MSLNVLSSLCIHDTNLWHVFDRHATRTSSSTRLTHTTRDMQANIIQICEGNSSGIGLKGESRTSTMFMEVDLKVNLEDNAKNQMSNLVSVSISSYCHFNKKEIFKKCPIKEVQMARSFPLYTRTFLVAGAMCEPSPEWSRCDTGLGQAEPTERS